MSTTTMKCGLQQHPWHIADRVLVVVTAPLVALAGWVVTHVVLGVDLVAKTGSSEVTVGVGSVVEAALLAGTAGWALMGLIERRRCHSRRPWTVVAVTVLVVSLLGPLGAASTAAGVSMLCLHLLVGLVIILGLRHTAC